MADFIVKEDNKILGSTKIKESDELLTNNMLDMMHWVNSTDGTMVGGQDWSSGGFQADMSTIVGLETALQDANARIDDLTQVQEV